MLSSILFIRRFIINIEELKKLPIYYKENKLAHAYLISTNNIEKCYKVLLDVIKNIFCINEYRENCNKCTLCHLIDINNLPSLKVISPDGAFIKKDQIIELKNLFSRESQYTKDSIYVIKEAEKMNKESANTMLKFLEEPDGSVIGFFITNEIDNIMPTIQSRTQHLEIFFENNEAESIGVDNEIYEQYLKIISEYLYKLEVEKKESILYNRKYIFNLEKDEIKNILKILLRIYQGAFENKIKNKPLNEYSYLSNYSLDNLKKKINLLIELLKQISYNVNVELLMDKFVIEIEVINNETI